MRNLSVALVSVVKPIGIATIISAVAGWQFIHTN